MDLSHLLGQIEGGDDDKQVAPDLVKDLERFTEEQSANTGKDSEQAFSTLGRDPLKGTEQQEAAAPPAVVPPPSTALPVIVKAETRTTTVEFSNGSRYIGDLLDGKPHGKGCIYYKNGSRYEGNFVDGEKDGFGVYEYSNTVKYEGLWKAGKKHGAGVIEFPGAAPARFHGTFHEGECRSGQLWSDGLLAYSGGADLAYHFVPPNATAASLHLNFSAPLDADSLHLIYSRLRQLRKLADQKLFYYFIKSCREKLEASGDSHALSAVQDFLAQNFVTKRPKGRVYRVLRATERPEHGLSAPSPLASAAALPISVLHANSQYHVMTNSVAWILYQVARSYWEKRAVPRVVQIDLQRVIGQTSTVQGEADEYVLLEGFVPAAAVVRTLSFTRPTALLKRLFEVSRSLRTGVSFGAYEDWILSFDDALQPAELHELLAQAERAHRLAHAAPLDVAAPNRR